MAIAIAGTSGPYSWCLLRHLQYRHLGRTIMGANIRVFICICHMCMYVCINLDFRGVGVKSCCCASLEAALLGLLYCSTNGS